MCITTHVYYWMFYQDHLVSLLAGRKKVIVDACFELEVRKILLSSALVEKADAWLAGGGHFRSTIFAHTVTNSEWMETIS